MTPLGLGFGNSKDGFFGPARDDAGHEAGSTRVVGNGGGTGEIESANGSPSVGARSRRLGTAPGSPVIEQWQQNGADGWGGGDEKGVAGQHLHGDSEGGGSQLSLATKQVTMVEEGARMDGRDLGPRRELDQGQELEQEPRKVSCWTSLFAGCGGRAKR